MTFIHYYLIIINIIGFILFAINTLLYTYTADKEIDKLLTLASILGGSLGIVIAIFLIDRKAVKGNMMSRVFVFSVLVIQIALCLIIKNFNWSTLLQNILSFYSRYKPLLIYLVIINVISFIAYGIDKFNAIYGRSRIRIITLLFLAFIGGSIGSISAMYLFRHKTSKDYFTVGVPLIMLMQLFVLVYLLLL